MPARSAARAPRARTGAYSPTPGRQRLGERGGTTGSRHAGGVDTYALTYRPDGRTHITDPLGTVRSYSFSVQQQQVVRLVGLPAPCTSGCGDQAQSLSRDANGNVTGRRDINGHLTCATYDLARNLETRRVEGLTGSACRRISFTYDAEGNALTRTEQATSDADGQRLTVDGPRTDVSDVTTYAYYADTTADHRRGDLQRLTNALGHVTTFTRYDGAGRLLQSSAPNGVVSTYTYDARGRLTGATTAGDTTTLAYDAAGHRRVLSLDAAGHLLGETWRTPDGSVARSRTRQYDALGWLTRLIGAAGQTTQYAHDAEGNPTTVTDPKAQPTGRAYDALNRLATEPYSRSPTRGTAHPAARSASAARAGCTTAPGRPPFALPVVALRPSFRGHRA